MAVKRKQRAQNSQQRWDKLSNFDENWLYTDTRNLVLNYF